MGESGFVTAGDGVRLHYVKVGEGADWLVCPGVGGEADFAPVARRRTVVFFDVRNRGRSDAVPDDGQVGMPVEIDDIEAVRRHFGVDRIDVLGWSYPGLVAGLYAARHPRHVGRLVLVCPLPVREHPLPTATEADHRALAEMTALVEQGLDTRDPVGFARASRRITAPTRMGDPAAAERLQGDPAQWPNEWPDHVTAALGRVMDTLPAGYDHRDELRSITAPTLVVAGEVDRFPTLGATREWAAVVPGARLVTLPGVGHFPQVEAPDGLFAAVDEHLAGPTAA